MSVLRQDRRQAMLSIRRYIWGVGLSIEVSQSSTACTAESSASKDEAAGQGNVDSCMNRLLMEAA